MQLKDLVGKHIFQGIEVGKAKPVQEDWSHLQEVNYIAFRLDGVTYRAYENECDGYRSYCEDLEIVEDIPKTKLPDIEVLCVYDDGFNDVIHLLDVVTGKTVLSVGTNDYDDYYPYCVMEYYPENLACNIGR